MLSTRNAITAVVALTVLSIGATVYNLTQPPDGGGLGRNSYGTRAHGHRAIYETMEKLNLPVRRSHFPPPVGLEAGDHLVMIGPNQRLVEHEPEHLRRTAEWVNAGGQMLVVLKSPEVYSFTEDRRDRTWETSVLEELGLPGIKAAEIWPLQIASPEDDAAEKDRIEREKVLSIQVNEERPTAATTVTLDGAFASLRSDVTSLRLPREDLHVLEITTSAPQTTGRITVQSNDEVNYTLAAVFPRGQGRITVLSDESLFNNYLITAEDNPVLAANLTGSTRGPAVFDEFFHGLSSRGNPLWLLTRPYYGWLFIMVIAAAAIWIWRQSAALGPPVPYKEPTRRTLTEYLDAMATLFTRSRQKKFVLEELRDGVLWALRTELHLAPAQEKVEVVAAALERHHPARARRVRRASAEIDKALAERESVDNAKFIELTREISRCL